MAQRPLGWKYWAVRRAEKGWVVEVLRAGWHAGRVGDRPRTQGVS